MGGALIVCLTATSGCRAAPQRSPDQRPASGLAGIGAGPTGSPRQQANAREASPGPKCVGVGDLSAPRNVRGRKPELSDLRGIPTNAGVLVFDLTIMPSGSVSDVRLVNTIDTQYPWPALADRWRSAISDWQYEPATVNGQPVAVCLTLTVIIHVA